MQSYSIVQYLYDPDRDGHHCGYCKTDNGSISNGLWAYKLTIQDYQDMIDRGWRRSGLYCYKPMMNRTCCPAYTIKCDASEVRLTKTQKKVLKRFTRYLHCGEKSRAPTSDTSARARHEGGEYIEKAVAGHQLKEGDVAVIKPIGQSAVLVQTQAQQPVKVQGSSSTNSEKRPSDPMDSFPSKSGGANKAKRMRLEKRIEKMKTRGISEEEALAAIKAKVRKKNKEKSLEDLIAGDAKPNAPHRLEVKLVQSCPPSKEFEETFEAAQRIYKKYQMAIHHDQESDCSAEQFRRFLCKSPLLPKQSASGVKYGSFHQQYWLDGNLIMVGVVDVLPHCISSVYLFFDPDYSFLSLGVYSALREIAFTRSLHARCSELKNYYMGFYIHSCPKMRYKGQFRPSYLACPESFRWVPIEKCIPKLDHSKYSRLEDDPAVADENGRISNLDDALILHEGELMRFEDYKQVGRQESTKILEEYAALVGRVCLRRMVLAAESFRSR